MQQSRNRQQSKMPYSMQKSGNRQQSKAPSRQAGRRGQQPFAHMPTPHQPEGRYSDQYQTPSSLATGRLSSDRHWQHEDWLSSQRHLPNGPTGYQGYEHPFYPAYRESSLIPPTAAVSLLRSSGQSQQPEAVRHELPAAHSTNVLLADTIDQLTRILRSQGQL